MTANIKVVVLAGLFFGLGLVVGSQRNAFSPVPPQTDAAIIAEESKSPAVRVKPSVEGLAASRKPAASSSARKQKKAGGSQRGFEIVDIDAKITERNNVWWRFAWKLTLRNRSSAALLLDATIEFHDSDGFVVDEDRQSSLVLSARETKTFTGYDLINAETALNVSRFSAKVSRR